MGLALVLIVFVMRAASKEQLYEPFFPGSHTFTAVATPSLVDEHAASENSSAISPQPGSDSTPSSESSDRLAQWIAAKLPPTTQVQWSLLLMSLRRGIQSGPLPENARKDLIELANQFDHAPVGNYENRLQSWQELIRSHATTTFTDDPQDGSAGSSRVSAEIMLAIENALLNQSLDRVADGSVWRSSDQDALRMLLERHKFEDHKLGRMEKLALFSKAAPTSVVALLQQPDAFRARIVRIDATLARVDRIESLDNAPERDFPSYWQLWLRPRSGVQRPLVAIVGTLPASLIAYENNPVGPAPRISVAGQFLKRLAYQSSVGADMAPVIVGAIWQSDEPSTKATPSASDPQRATLPVSLAAILAVAAGVALATFLFWGSLRSASRLRQQRLARQAATLPFAPELMETSATKPTESP